MHKIITSSIVGLALAGGIGLAACGSSTSTHHAAAAPQQQAPTPSAPATTAPPTSAAPAPAPSPTTQQPDTVTYQVTGDAPMGAISPDVTYGPSGSDIQGTVPMDVTQDIPSSPPSFYAINAQLSDAGGSIACSIAVDGKVISQGSATGAANICSAEISQDPISGNWTNTNSGG